MRYDTKIKSTYFPKTFIFFDEKHFSKDFEKSKISKSHFFRFLLKNSTFSKSQLFRGKQLFFRFLKFSIFQNLSKNIFRRKNKCFWKIFTFYLFYRISCITSSSGIAELPLCRPWARLMSPPKIRKSKKFIFLKIFGSTFSL